MVDRTHCAPTVHPRCPSPDNAGKSAGSAHLLDLLERVRRNVRVWVFRIATAIAAPAVILLAAEAGLRVVGYGDSREFTGPCTLQRESAFFEKGRFTLQVFPPGMFSL